MSKILGDFMRIYIFQFLGDFRRSGHPAIDLSLKMSPSRQTLFKAWDISKKTPQDSRPGYVSKAV